MEIESIVIRCNLMYVCTGMLLLIDGDGVESGNLETSSQSSQDDFDADDTNDKGLPKIFLQIS